MPSQDYAATWHAYDRSMNLKKQEAKWCMNSDHNRLTLSE